MVARARRGASGRASRAGRGLARVDGAEVGTGTPNTGTIAYGLQFDDLELGNYLATDVCGYTYGFPGDLDQVSIYGKALTADEVAMLAKGDQPAPPALPGPPPVPKAPTPLPGRSLGPKVEGIEVTQATQTFDQPRSLTYTGVPLIKHKKTVVRVFADLVGPEAVGGPGARPPMGMALFATDGAGRALPGSPLFPEWAPSTATMSRGDDFLTEAERNSETSAFTFTLPDAWTLGTVNVEARALGSGLCIEAACGTTASRTLSGVSFRDPPPASEVNLLEQPVVLHAGGDPNGTVTGINVVKPRPEQIFQKLLALSPLNYHFLDLEGRPADWPRYRATRFASDSAIWEAADAYDESIGRPGLATVGVFEIGANPGVTIGHTSVVTGKTYGSGMWQPVTSDAHEVFHQHGFKHASGSCGGGAIGGQAEAWPVRDGRLDSVGIDTTPGSGGGSAPYRVIADTEAQPAYDLMSYCGLVVGDPQHWISVRNWDRLLNVTPPPPDNRPWLRNTLVVRAQFVRSILSILAVASAQGPPPPDPGPSPYVLVASGIAGQTLARVAVSRFAGTGAPGSDPVDALEARVPATGVTKVEVQDAGGVVVASRTASRAAPRARILAPARGRSVGGPKGVVVRWKATDADDDPLEVTLDYSSDGGHSFHNVWAGPNGRGTARLRTELLTASRRARLRLRVSDGFRETTTTSARFVVAARRPLVKILEPGPGLRADAGGAVRLRGAAADARGRRLIGRRLVWRAGRTVLGRGTSVDSTLPAGTRRVSLTATDRDGRAATASVGLRVRATTPFFVHLRARPLRRSARAVVLIVSATQPATLRVGGRRHHVGPAARRIRVPVGRARTIRLRLTLTAGGRRSSSTLVVRRR